VLLVVALPARSRGNRAPNLLLAALLLLSVVFLLEHVTAAFGTYRRIFFLIGLASSTPFLIGPLFWIYVRMLLGPPFASHAPLVLHAIPAALHFPRCWQLYTHPNFDGAAYAAYLRSPGLHPIEPAAAIPMTLATVLLLVYTLRSAAVIRNREAELKSRVSDTALEYFVWLRWMVKGLCGVVFFCAFELAFIFVVRSCTVWLDLTFVVIFAMIIVYTGYVALWQPDMFTASIGDRNGNGRPLSLEEPLADVVARVVGEMEEGRAYRVHDLSLRQLASRVGITPHQLSRLINEKFGINFYDFVNSYRIREAQERIATGEADAYSIMGIASEAGFRSKSSFNRAFRKHTGTTPSAFRRHK